MAYLAQDDKQLQNGQAAPVDPAAGSGQSSIVGGGQAGATVGGQPISTAGVGKGGAGGWTNIQAYLGANEGKQEESANKLNSTVGGQFQQEKSNLDTQSADTKAKAQAEVDKNKIGQDQASQMIEKMGSQYQYPTATPAQPNNPLAAAPAPTEYDQYRSQLQGGLNAQYKGPDAFNYALGADTQKYGTSLAGDDTFKGLMGDIYNQAAGGTLARGGRLLQNQLDSGNQYLTDARTKLLGDYSGLSTGIGTTMDETNNAIAGSRDAVIANALGLKTGLQTMGTQQYDALGNAVKAHDLEDQTKRKAEGNIYWEDPGVQGPNDWYAGNTGFLIPGANGAEVLSPQFSGIGMQKDTNLGRVAYNVADAQRATQTQLSALARQWGVGEDQLKGMYANGADDFAFKNANNYFDDTGMSKYISGVDQTTKGVGDTARGQYNSILDVLGMSPAAIQQHENMKDGKYVMANNNSQSIYDAGHYTYKKNKDPS